MVEGFDRKLVEAMRPYVSVHPLFDGDGINPNTAPPWVLALLYHGVGDLRFADEEVVRNVLETRERGDLICAEETGEECTAIGGEVEGEIFPPPTFVSDVFRVESIARYGDVERTLTTWISREDPGEPVWLGWDLR